ncbi:hypothetical protein [Deinococcus sp. NW-56]|uniref:hypothetical protein n=1 Tax=Deinococcus sp. NW-56 TaxID=2080419 RepID=UPI000CF55553|nr:hypothetical protein [Deinococcus sp. NW-56]
MIRPETSAALAQAFPHRFIWFAKHNVLRISADGHHRTGGPCVDAFLDTELHGGIVQAALQAECDARGWGWTQRVLRGKEGTGYIGRVWVLEGEAEEARYLGVETAPTALQALAEAVLAAARNP